MLKRCVGWVLFWVFLIQLEAQAVPPVAPPVAPLSAVWKLEDEFPSSNSLLQPSIQRVQFLFVSGFNNLLADRTLGYFSTYRRMLRNQFDAAVHYYGPWSHHSIEKNADLLAYELRRLRTVDERPVVLVGHSKGGAEILLMLLRYPELLLEGAVDRVVLIQSAIGGTPLAEGQFGGASYFKRALTGMAYLLFREGMASLQPSNTRIVFHSSWERIRDERGSDIRALLSQRIFYVRSHLPHIRFHPVISPVQWASIGSVGPCEGECSDPHSSCEEHGRHDGLLRLSDQIYRPDGAILGTDLGLLEANHLDLVLDWMSRFNTASKESFMRALIRLVFDDLRSSS
jgi:pimeloyl-ACP methyl ester carboxylesterase